MGAGGDAADDWKYRSLDIPADRTWSWSDRYRAHGGTQIRMLAESKY